MRTGRIDLNSDLGEGLGSWTMGDDEALLDIVTSANVACGFHAGDPPIMRAVTRMAARRGVAVGAHVAYRDHAGFGRRFIEMEPSVLTDEVVYQIGALEAMARRSGHRVTYVKPHGALVPRGRPGAVLHDPELIARRCVAMATGEPVEDVKGDPLTLAPDSICVHGDTPGAVGIARRVRSALEEVGVRLAPFAPGG